MSALCTNVKDPFWCIDTAFYLDNVSPVVNLEFLSHALHVLDLARLSIVVGVPGVSRKDIEAQKIPLPPLPEQERIVEILRAADELRQLRAQANQRAQDLLPALFHEMFGTPDEWEDTIPLEQIVDFVGGGTPSRKIKHYFEGDIPWATSKDIKSRYLNDSQEHVTDEAIGKSSTKLVPASTILMVVKSKILVHSLPLGITTRPFCFGQDLKGLVCKEGVEPLFVYSALQSQRQYLLRRARGVNTEGITLEMLRDMPIPEVHESKQDAFVMQVKEHDLLDREIRSATHHVQALHDSLIARAFNGELTADWRTAHHDELVQAARERDEILGRKPATATPAPEVEQLPLPPAQPRARRACNA